jgi:alpha-amylase
VKSLAPVLLCSSLLLGCATRADLESPPEQIDAAAPVAAAPEYRSLRFEQGEQRWWHTATVYEIWPRSFKDSDGDGSGDFNGMTSKLDHLQALGVNAIWLTPVFETPSYHGYDFQDFYRVERDYGTMAQFERFIAESHQRGIKVVLDLVLNHISDQHDWFLKSARREPGFEDYFVWREQRPAGWGQAWSNQPNPEAVWHWNDTRKAYYYGAFGGSQPDVNLRNPKVVAELDALAAFWLDKGVDGFRLDAVRYAIEDGPLSQQADTQATIDYWTHFSQRVKAINPEALLVGEAWAALETGGRYRNGGQGLDAAFDFDFGDIVIAALNPQATRRADFGTLSHTDTGKKRESLWTNLQQRAAAAPSGYFSPFLTNHDQNRLMHALGDDTAKAKIAASLLLTSPGTAYLYYGEEIGMSQHAIGEDRYRRAPMQWNDDANAGFNASGRNWIDLPAPQGYRGDQGAWWAQYWRSLRGKGHSVAAQQSDPASLLNHYKRLLAVRRNNITLQQPQELRYYPVAEANVWLVQALADGRDVWVAINLDPKTAATFDVPAALRGERTEQLSGTKKTLGERATLNRGESWIF